MRSRSSVRAKDFDSGGETVPHLAKPLGARDDPGFQQAYWKAFNQTFGDQNAKMVKSMLLSKVKKADTGDTELDRVCQGLRMTMGWLAEAIERSALTEAGYEDKREPPRPPGGSSPGSHEDKVVSS